MTSRTKLGLLLALVVAASCAHAKGAPERHPSHAFPQPVTLTIAPELEGLAEAHIRQAFSTVQQYPGAELEFDLETGHLMPTGRLAPRTKDDIACGDLDEMRCATAVANAVNTLPGNPIPGATAQLRYRVGQNTMVVNLLYTRIGTDSAGNPIYGWMVTSYTQIFPKPNEEQ